MTYEELVRDHSRELIEKLVTEVLSKDFVDIRFEFEDDDQWSMISMHIYEEDKEVSLRLHAGDQYDLCLGYYDDKDDFFEIIQLLTPDEKDSLPKKLQKVMEKVLTGEKGVRIPCNLLSH